MATYAVGDVQGCYAELNDLLDAVAFGADDQLWLAGDLVNRGPESLAVVELAMGLGERCTTVLGNHDLHLLAIHYGGHKVSKSDTFRDVLASPNLAAIGEWYCRQPLLVMDTQPDYAVPTYVMTHAGIPHCWSLSQAQSLAAEVEQVLLGGSGGGSGGDARTEYFEHLYGNRPDRWSDDLSGLDRLRLITNYFTRMRLIQPDGRLNFSHKGELATAPVGWSPWYALRERPESVTQRILFGHWAALDSSMERADVICLDTGCVWGRALTALCLQTGELIQVPARQSSGVN